MAIVAKNSLTLSNINDGTNGKTQYTHIAYSNIKFLCKESQNFTLSEPSVVRFGVDTRWVYKEIQAGTYTANLPFFGSDPASGVYKHVELVSNFSNSNYINTTHIGVYVDFVESNSVDPSKYNWTIFKGNDGVGVKSTVITYAMSTSGTTAPSTGWTSTVPTLVKGQYLWTKTVWTYTDNSSETGYSVTYISKDGNNGTNGLAGKDGVGINSTIITYASHTNGTTAPTSGYTTTVPSIPAGQFLWTKTVWTYTDNSTETGYSVAMMGIKGDKGDQGTDGIAGKDGKGIKATAITYQASTDGTTAPTGTWSASVPTVAKGSFLWTRTIWTYTDNTTETGYAVAYMGTNGNNGTNGLAGKDGVGIRTTTITYVGSTSGTTAPTSGWTSTVPTVAAGSYLWTKTVWGYTDNTSETGYSVARMGLKGDPGTPGAPGAPGTNGTSGVIVSSVAPSSPQTGQLWQDTSTTPQLVKKWTGSEWVIWELYAQNLKADNISTISLNLGDMTGGTVKLMDDVAVGDTLKKYGIYQSKLGLLSSGPSLSAPGTFSDSQMGVANLNRGELRFIVNDYTENLKTVQETGMSDTNNAFIKFDSYDNGKDVMVIGSSGDIVFKGITSQDTPWIPLGNGATYKSMFSRIYISISVSGNGSSYIQFGTLPSAIRPLTDKWLVLAAESNNTNSDRHVMVRASDGAVILWNSVQGAVYNGEVSYTL